MLTWKERLWRFIEVWLTGTLRLILGRWLLGHGVRAALRIHKMPMPSDEQQRKNLDDFLRHLD